MEARRYPCAQAHGQAHSHTPGARSGHGRPRRRPACGDGSTAAVPCVRPRYARCTSARAVPVRLRLRPVPVSRTGPQPTVAAPSSRRAETAGDGAADRPSPSPQSRAAHAPVPPWHALARARRAPSHPSADPPALLSRPAPGRTTGKIQDGESAMPRGLLGRTHHGSGKGHTRDRRALGSGRLPGAIGELARDWCTYTRTDIDLAIRDDAS